MQMTLQTLLLKKVLMQWKIFWTLMLRKSYVRCKFTITIHYIIFTNIKHGFHLFSFLPCPCLILLSSIQYCFCFSFSSYCTFSSYDISIFFLLDSTSGEGGKWHVIGVRKSRHYRRQEINFINNVILFYKQLILMLYPFR